MILILITVFGLAAGYVAAVLLYLLATFFLATSAPNFVSSRGRFRSIYLLATAAIWLICALIGGYLATWLAEVSFPWLPVSILAIALAAVTWLHPIEAKKQFAGLARFFMPVASVAGVALGYYIRIIRIHH